MAVFVKKTLKKGVDKGRYIVYNKQADEVRDKTWGQKEKSWDERKLREQSFEKTSKKLEKSFKKVLTKGFESDIITKLSRKAVARSSLKIEQQDKQRLRKFFWIFKL